MQKVNNNVYSDFGSSHDVPFIYSGTLCCHLKPALTTPWQDRCVMSSCCLWLTSDPERAQRRQHHQLMIHLLFQRSVRCVWVLLQTWSSAAVCFILLLFGSLEGFFFFCLQFSINKKIYTCYQKLPERFQQRACLSAGCWHVEVLTCVSASSGQLKQRGAESDLNPKNYSHVKTLSDVSVSFASSSLIIIIRL